jgi:enoyl-CoA hydratase/carnithine racemase
MAETYDAIRYDVTGDTATITFDRPTINNALDRGMYAEVKHAVRSATVDGVVDFIVLQGSGGNFAAGGDLSEISGMLESPGMPLYEFADALPFNAIRHSSKVTIAAVSGWCCGGGLIMAGSCDVVLAIPDAKFAVLEGRVGIGDPWIPSLLKDRISTAKLSLLMLTGRSVDAREAERIGLVSELLEDGDLGRGIEHLLADLRRTTRGSRSRYKAQLLATQASVPDEGPAIEGIDDEMRALVRRWVR